MLSQATAQIPQVQIWHIDSLVFYARNPRKNDAAVDRQPRYAASPRGIIPKLPIEFGQLFGDFFRVQR